MKRMILGLSLGLCCVLAAACYGAYYHPYYYATAYYSPYWYWYDGAMTYAWVDANGVVHYTTALTSEGGATRQANAIDVNATAVAIANTANTYFQPNGCASATVAGPVITYRFDNCAGPQSLRTVSGGVTLTVSDGGGKLVLAAKSDGLQINGGAFVLDSVVTVQTVGDSRQVTIDSHSFSPGQADARTAQAVMTWTSGSGCFSMEGQDTPVQGDLSSTDALSGFASCNGQCPSSGSIRVISGEGTFTGNFDGTNTLVVKDPQGGEKSYQLQCQ